MRKPGPLTSGDPARDLAAGDLATCGADSDFDEMTGLCLAANPRFGDDVLVFYGVERVDV